MKKLFLLLIAAAGLQFTTHAQSQVYHDKMKQTLEQMDAAVSTQDLQEVSAQFERIGDAEKSQWLPYYYAALSQVNIGWRDQKTDKDKLAERAKAIIAKAEALEKNAELCILKNMIATQQMLVDPASRFMTYGMEAGTHLETAKKLDANNPRIYYLEGSSVLNTPEAFGGGKQNAKPILQRSVELYKTYQPASPLHPKWGQKQAEELLAKCSS